MDSDAAVGLLSLSAASLLRVAFLMGGGGGGGALRERASDAAVGANRPEDGVFGLATAGLGFCAADDLGREGVDGAVLGAGRAWRAVEGFDATDWPVCWDLSGCETDDWRDDFGGVLAEDLAEELLTTGERVFLGVAVVTAVRRVPVVGVDLPVPTAFPLDGGDITGSGDAGVGVVGRSAGGAGSGMG